MKQLNIQQREMELLLLMEQTLIKELLEIIMKTE